MRDVYSEGCRAISRSFREYKLDGYVDGIVLRGYRLSANKKEGIANFGVRVRGYTAGNYDFDIPLAFNLEEGTVSQPVIAFFEGKTILLGRSFFAKLFSSRNYVNIKRQYMPGWMSREDIKHYPKGWVYNNPNKYDLTGINR